MPLINDPLLIILGLYIHRKCRIGLLARDIRYMEWLITAIYITFFGALERRDYRRLYYNLVLLRQAA